MSLDVTFTPMQGVYLITIPATEVTDLDLWIQEPAVLVGTSRRQQVEMLAADILSYPCCVHDVIVIDLDEPILQCHAPHI